MKNWNKSKYNLAALIMAVALLSSTVSVLAYANLDFSKKAKEWQSRNCTEKELDLPNASDKSAICYGIVGVDKNAAEISSVKQAIEANGGNDSIYTLINTDVTYPNFNAGVHTVESIVPVDGVISNLTLLAKGNTDKVIDSGRLDIKVLVNGADVAFGTSIDSETTRNAATSNNIQVNAGDVIRIEMNASDGLYITGTTQQSCQTYNNYQLCNPGSLATLGLNIGLYLKAQ